MKTSIINQATVLMLDKIDTVKVCFKPYIEGCTDLYTYKAPKGVYEAGMLAVVITPDNQYKVVQVHSVDEVPDFDPYSSFQYKWLVQPLDLTVHDKYVGIEKELGKLIISAERNRMLADVKAEVQERLGVDSSKVIEALTSSDSEKKEN